MLSFDGTYVNEHHVKLLVDTMTHEGTLQPMTRHGITKVNGGVFQRASFEETMEVFLEAATFASTDQVTGVTENIMLGKLAPVGTAAFDLVCSADLCTTTPDVQQFVPKRVKCLPLFSIAEAERESSSSTRDIDISLPSLTSGQLTVQPLSDSEDEDHDVLSADQVAAMEGVLRSPEYAPSSPVVFGPPAAGYVPSSPIYL